MVDERCYSDSDCADSKICSAGGECVFECVRDSDCGPAFSCKDHVCVLGSGSGEPIDCPDEMVPVENAYCIDRYEASRPDATEAEEGVQDDFAQSIPGVMPWQENDNAVVEAACEAVGKTLCTPAQWEQACHGPDDTVYAYGNVYNEKTCNGIKTYSPDVWHVAPTGSFPDCTNEYGVFDMNGNVWEQTYQGNETTVRGGAYNCMDSETYHRCDYIPKTWTPKALGFRCCLIPDGEAQEGGE